MLVGTMLFLPYRRTEDNILAVAAILLLLLTYFGGVLVKVFQDISRLAGAVHTHNFASDVLGIDSISGIVGMVLVFAFTLLLVIVVTIYQALEDENRVQTLRPKSTGLPPSLVLARGHRWMLFLSHVSSELPDVSARLISASRVFANAPPRTASPCCKVWTTGQDQMATVKRQLQRMLPGFQCFLDVRQAASNQKSRSASLPSSH